MTHQRRKNKSRPAFRVAASAVCFSELSHLCVGSRDRSTVRLGSCAFEEGMKALETFDSVRGLLCTLDKLGNSCAEIVCAKCQPKSVSQFADAGMRTNSKAQCVEAKGRGDWRVSSDRLIARCGLRFGSPELKWQAPSGFSRHSIGNLLPQFKPSFCWIARSMLNPHRLIRFLERV